MKSTHLIAAMTALCLAMSCVAQEPDNGADDRFVAEDMLRRLSAFDIDEPDQYFSGGSGDPGRSRAQQLQIVASSEDKLAKLNLFARRYALKERGNRENDLLVMGTLAVGFDESKQKSVTFGDLSGLNGGASFTLNLSNVRFNTFDPEAPAEADIMTRICEDFARRTGSTDVDGDNCDSSVLDDTALNQWRRESTGFRQMFQNIGRFNLGLKVNAQEFKYVDAVTLESKKDTEAGFSITPSFTKLGIGGATNSLAFGLSYEQSYKAADSTTLCRAFSEGVQRCDTHAVGGPSRNDKHIAYMEFRSFRGNTAYGLRLSRDFKTDVTGLQVPIFLFRDKADLFTGGVQLDYDTLNDDPSLSLIFGVPFTLF